MKVAIVGGGVMGEAILGAALERAVFVPEQVTVVEKVDSRRTQLADSYGVTVTSKVADAAEADAVIVCVKPQEAGSAGFVLKEGALLLSIMAGVTVRSLRDRFRAERIVRVMPNTPAAARAGMSVWTATDEVPESQREFTRRLLSALGRELFVDDEKKIDMATAVSGSGPAYVFLFIEALIEGAVAVGLPRPAAEELVLQTVQGSALYAQESTRSPSDLRAMVTSPGGTTAAGLLALEKAAFRAAIIECIRAAHQRAQELGNA